MPVEIICEQNDNLSCMFFVLEGVISITKKFINEKDEEDEEYDLIKEN